MDEWVDGKWMKIKILMPKITLKVDITWAWGLNSRLGDAGNNFSSASSCYNRAVYKFCKGRWLLSFLRLDPDRCLF